MLSQSAARTQIGAREVPEQASMRASTSVEHERYVGRDQPIDGARRLTVARKFAWMNANSAARITLGERAWDVHGLSPADLAAAYSDERHGRGGVALGRPNLTQ